MAGHRPHLRQPLLRRGRAQGRHRCRDIRALILVDMIGDRDLRISRESNSTAWLTDIIWGAARRLEPAANSSIETLPIEDDHLPFLEAGVPSVDIIDLDYAAWHTAANDTLDNVSARVAAGRSATCCSAALPEIESSACGRPSRMREAQRAVLASAERQNRHREADVLAPSASSALPDSLRSAASRHGSSLRPVEHRRATPSPSRRSARSTSSRGRQPALLQPEDDVRLP